MQLNLAIHQVEAVEFGQQTALSNGRLSIQRDALQAELLEDRRLGSVQLELARAGESCRMLPVFDIVEPRAKLDPAGRDFPGALSPIAGVGWGTTRVLRGLGVTVLDPRDRLPGHVLDMRSPQDVSRYAGLHHLVLVPILADGIAPDDANNALRLASLRAAAWLARSVAVEDAPDELRELRLTPVDDELPRVAYVYQLHSHQRPTVAGEPLLYGDNCRHLLPTILHPNEVLDGAVVRSYTYLNMETCSIQNNGVILDLYDRHGRDLNFVGVVVYVANQLAEERQRATLMASNLVRYTLAANGAVFTKSGGGAPNVDMALIAERCEQLGVKTALLVWETAGPNAGDEDATLFNAPSLDAIVSIGASQLTLDLGPVERLIAPDGANLTGPLTIPSNQLCGATDHLGASAFMGVRY
jgi:glycine reductase complex component B subunit alpha and beta